MFFNKNLSLFSLIASVVIIDCNATEASVKEETTEQRGAKIPDVSKILPPVTTYIEKMKEATERYKNVYKEMNEEEAKQRIDNAKQKALNFYAKIF